MAYVVQQNDIDLLHQSDKRMFVKIELLDKNLIPIAVLEGDTIEGACTIDAESDIRRVCDLTIHLKDNSYLTGEDKKIWLDKYIKVYIGLMNTRTKKVQWYNLGIYLFTNAAYTYSPDSQTLSISSCDLMANLTGLMNGQLVGIETIIEEGADLRDAMVNAVEQLGFVKKYIINDILAAGTPVTVPYDLKFSAGQTVYEVISGLRDLYPAWETFFDTDGTFIYQMIPTCEDDDIILDESVMREIVSSESINDDWSQVRNSVLIYGVQKKDGTQIVGRFRDTNPDSPYCIDKIGERLIVLNDSEYSKIPTDDLANQRAEYECWLRTRMQDSVTLETVLVPWLDVNKKIRYTSWTTGETHDYIIKSLDFDFSTGIMTINAIRFYPLYPLVISE